MRKRHNGKAVKARAWDTQGMDDMDKVMHKVHGRTWCSHPDTRRFSPGFASKRRNDMPSVSVLAWDEAASFPNCKLLHEISQLSGAL